MLILTFAKICKILAMASRSCKLRLEKTKLQCNAIKGTHRARECVPFDGVKLIMYQTFRLNGFGEKTKVLLILQAPSKSLDPI